MLTPSAEHNVHDDILTTIGHTPLVRLNRVTRGLAAPIYAKVEFFNPGGSVKDRIALRIIEEAEQSGRLKPGGTVVEGTSGNTGMGLAIVCALKGYKAIFVMPDKMSEEKIRMLRAFGARVVVTPTAVEPDDPRSYYSVSRRLVEETPNAILANQYHNPENPASHYFTTGPEIWEQTKGKVTDVVIGMGTGGTITGVARYLKEQNPNIRIVGVDIVGSLLYDAWKIGGKLPENPVVTTYKVEGIGEDFLPSTLDLTIVDDVVVVNDRESFLMTRRLVREEGLFIGGSCGSAVAGAVKYTRDLPANRLVVVILPDSGSRYLSKVFDDNWMRENGFLGAMWQESAAADVIAAKRDTAFYTAAPTDRMLDVVQIMKQHSISQVPVVANGKLRGIVREVDLLNHLLLSNHQHTADETIEPLIQPDVPTVDTTASVETLMSIFTHHDLAVVLAQQTPVSIITKIDMLDFLSQQLN